VWHSEASAPTVLVSAVCCKRGHADWWAPSRHRCRAAGGWVAHPSHCVVDYRVCCKRGLRDWWSASARACYRSGGAPVHRAYCRFD
jgi:type 1 glutamine amidotransferase